MNSKLSYGLIGVAIGGIVAWVIMSAAFSSERTNSMNMNSSQKSVMMNSNAMDAHFIEEMIPHHEDAIEMAKLSPNYSKKEEVRQLSLSIIASQSKEITQMKKWYKEWFGRDVPTGNAITQSQGMMSNSSMHMGTDGHDNSLSKLTQAQDFDVAFVEEMIPHHQMAVMMASMLKNGTQRPEMKKLADDIIKAQSDEIDKMQSWLEDWK